MCLCKEQASLISYGGPANSGHHRIDFIVKVSEMIPLEKLDLNMYELFDCRDSLSSKIFNQNYTHHSNCSNIIKPDLTENLLYIETILKALGEQR